MEDVKKNHENEIPENLADKIKKNLIENKESELLEQAFGNSQDDENIVDEEDPDILIKEKPLQSIAESLYHIERTLKALLYLKNIQADEGLSYSRENFYGILGGPDPELLQELELKRILKLQAEEKNVKE